MGKGLYLEYDQIFCTEAGRDIWKAQEKRESALNDMLKAMKAFAEAWKNEDDVIIGYLGQDVNLERKIGDWTFTSPIEVIEHIVEMNK